MILVTREAVTGADITTDNKVSHLQDFICKLRESDYILLG